MANLPENSASAYNWDEEGIYQLEHNDPVEGGAGGIANRQAEQLALRTRNLHERVVAVSGKLTDVQDGQTAVGTVRGGVDEAYNTLLKLRDWVNSQLQALGAGEPLTGAAVRDMLQALENNERLLPGAVRNVTGKADLAGNVIDFSGLPVLRKTITENTTLAATGLIENKSITLVVTGDFSLSFAPVFRKLSGDYNGAVDNFVQMLCTNADSGNEEIWYSISQENVD